MAQFSLSSIIYQECSNYCNVVTGYLVTTRETGSSARMHAHTRVHQHHDERERHTHMRLTQINWDRPRGFGTRQVDLVAKIAK